MDGNQNLEPLSHQLKVGDILELTLIDEHSTPGPKVEIPIAGKHVTKSHIFLDFCPQTLNLSKHEKQSDHTCLDIIIDHMDIFDSEKAYVATCDKNKNKSWKNQLVWWKKLIRD